MTEFADFMYYVLPIIIMNMAPLALVALGGLYSEKSGVINIALEGIMVMGAFVSVYFAIQFTGWFENMPMQAVVLIGLLLGTLIGIIFSLFHAFAAINMKSNQIISATALNLFAAAFAVFTARTIFGVRRLPFTETTRIREVPYLSDIPVIGPILFTNAYLSTYIIIVIFIVSMIVLYKTRLGLRLRSCGEHPQAADSLGVNVYKIRYIGVLLSGALAGMGGAAYAFTFQRQFGGDVFGFGFLALAVMISGQWKPMRILVVAFLFSVFRLISTQSGTLPGIRELPIPSQVYRMLPYIATLVILAFTSKRSQAPKAAGEPYDAGKR